MSGELFRALGALAEPPGAEGRRLAELLELPGPPPEASEHSGLFLFQLYPYASVYLGAEGQLGGEARDRIAGFWRALGRTPPAECDHLTALLGFYARLAELESEAPDAAVAGRWRHARRALLWEHLLSWLPPWLARLAEIGPPFYRAWGDLLSRALAEESAALGPFDGLPLHLRAAPPLDDPRREGGRAFTGSLLAAVRSGLVLVRSDLGRAAEELHLALRAGERRYALEALLAQDAPAILGWLAGEAAERARSHRQLPSAPPAIAGFWSERAAACGELLAALAAAAAEERRT